ncbi:MAG: HAD-IB family hydrolase [Myxococcota bacterium]|nr:HAD-IB family hydrolase [Myxococcota bacterium]
MAHHFFDMDHTLIDNDCDVSWKAFLIETGRADAAQRAEVERFYGAYERNELDERSFLAFQLAEFVGQGQATMRQLAEEHFEAKVRPTIFPQAWTLLADIVARGDQIHLLTATNRIVASPVAEYLTIPDVIATELEVDNNLYTGRIVDLYCCGPGKLERLERRCSQLEVELRDIFYYGDSVSDVIVLEAVGHPVATNPMPAVRELAARRHWPVLDF